MSINSKWEKNVIYSQWYTKNKNKQTTIAQTWVNL